MRINAITLGYAVPQKGFVASIHSVFQSAINLKLTPGEKMLPASSTAVWPSNAARAGYLPTIKPAKAGDLLTLVTSSDADLPQGIRVDAPQGFTFERLRINEQATCQNGILRFEKSPMIVDLRRAECWECNLSAQNLETMNPAVRVAWRTVWRALNDRQSSSGSEVVVANLLHPQSRRGSILIQRLADGVTALLEATASYERSVTPAVSALIGLGPGLTPVGDDLLVGYMAGLWCRIGKDSRRKRFISNLGQKLIDLSSNTTDISRTYLYHSALGQVSRRLADLAEAICKGMDPNDLLERANAAMQIGHTSGMDAVTGLLLGLAAWDEDLVRLGAAAAGAGPQRSPP